MDRLVDECLKACVQIGGSKSNINELLEQMLRVNRGSSSAGEDALPGRSSSTVSLKELACTKPVRLFGRDVIEAPLIEQCPFVPEDLRPIDFKEGTKTVYQLSAPCGSGKSPTMAYLSAAAQSAGCWVLVLLNIPNNQAIQSLAGKFHEIYDKLGVTQHTVTDDVFLKANDLHFKRHCNSLKNADHNSIWICKAEERQLGKLIAGIPAEAWSRCVVMFDEVHCFFSLMEKCRKKAEVNMWSMLFGPQTPKEASSVSSLRVRSVVFSDATPGDLPHVLLHRFNCKAGECKRICADMERIRARGYVSSADHVLFRAEGLPSLATPPNKGQWFGKDIHETMPDVAGAYFADRVRLADFEPNLREFCKDAFEVPCEGGGGSKFMLELTSVNKSEGGSNSVEHHAKAIARLFPGVLALAQHGAGTFHFDEAGVRTRYASHGDAHEALTSTPKYRGKPKYMITNIGYGSMTYGLPGVPVTHMYLGFKKEDNNILIKAQGAGRGCGYVRDDLARCGGCVKVLCTASDFEDMKTGLATYTEEAFGQYPDHAQGTYTNRIVCASQVGHASNPLAARARLTATVPLPPPVGGAGGSSSAASATTGAELAAPRDRTELWASVEEVVEAVTALPTRVLREADSLLVSEASAHEDALRALHPDVQMTTRVVFVTGSARQLKECEDAFRNTADASRTTINTDIGRAIRQEQVLALPPVDKNPTPRSAVLSPRSEVNNKRCNANPAHFGRRGGKCADTSYRMLWSYDHVDRRAVGIVRTVAFADLQLPFIHHHMTLNDDGSVGMCAMLVSRPPPGGGKPARKPRTPAACAKRKRV
jgi:hypothetical protein